MYEATGCVNTHKGLIFALSLLLGAWGVCASGGVSAREDVFAAAGRIISPRIKEELGEISRRGERGERLTHG